MAASTEDGAAAPPVFHLVCPLDDLWPGDTAVHEVADTRLLLLHTESGVVRAVQLMCPHQSFPMSDAALDGDVLTCARHLWKFDVVSGTGVNPAKTEIALYPVRIDDGNIYVSVAGIAPKFARP